MGELLGEDDGLLSGEDAFLGDGRSAWVDGFLRGGLLTLGGVGVAACFIGAVLEGLVGDFTEGAFVVLLDCLGVVGEVLALDGLAGDTDFGSLLEEGLLGLDNLDLMAGNFLRPLVGDDGDVLRVGDEGFRRGATGGLLVLGLGVGDFSLDGETFLTGELGSGERALVGNIFLARALGSGDRFLVGELVPGLGSIAFSLEGDEDFLGGELEFTLLGLIGSGEAGGDEPLGRLILGMITFILGVGEASLEDGFRLGARSLDEFEDGFLIVETGFVGDEALVGLLVVEDLGLDGDGADLFGTGEVGFGEGDVFLFNRVGEDGFPFDGEDGAGEEAGEDGFLSAVAGEDGLLADCDTNGFLTGELVLALGAFIGTGSLEGGDGFFTGSGDVGTEALLVGEALLGLGTGGDRELILGMISFILGEDGLLVMLAFGAGSFSVLVDAGTGEEEVFLGGEEEDGKDCFLGTGEDDDAFLFGGGEDFLLDGAGGFVLTGSRASSLISQSEGSLCRGDEVRLGETADGGDGFLSLGVGEDGFLFERADGFLFIGARGSNLISKSLGNLGRLSQGGSSASKLSEIVVSSLDPDSILSLVSEMSGSCSNTSTVHEISLGGRPALERSVTVVITVSRSVTITDVEDLDLESSLFGEGSVISVRSSRRSCTESVSISSVITSIEGDSLLGLTVGSMAGTSSIID